MITFDILRRGLLGMTLSVVLKSSQIETKFCIPFSYCWYPDGLPRGCSLHALHAGRGASYFWLPPQSNGRRFFEPHRV